ncbi:MAG: hypothetical protein EYC70_16280 [Planctomycetota bacterium]|nr:MAG: hypothetical protein EYC70_16280 [Planctomycetota bacterium]
MTALLLSLLLQAQAPAQAPAAAVPAPIPDPAVPGRGNPDLDVQHYELHLLLAPPQPRLSAWARVELQALRPLDQVELDLHHQLRVQSAHVGGESARFAQARDRLRVRLPRRAAAGQVLAVELRYGGPLPEEPSQGEPVGLLADARGLVSYLEPDGAHHFFPCNDHPSDKARFDVVVRVPLGSYAAATGELRGLGFEPGSRSFHWGTDRPTAPYLLALAAGAYAPILRPGTPPLLDLAWPEDEEQVRNSLADTARMIPFLAERYGPYPFERYGHVFTARAVGGLENQTMTVLGREAGLDGDPALIVHELAHQWFGDWVSPRQWRDLWLNEGWATYLELRWREAQGGAEERARTLRPWRASTLRLAQRQSPWTLADPDPSNLFDADLVYNKGGMVLHLLAEYLGRQRFDAAAAQYLAAFGGGNAGTEDFQAAMAQAAGEDLGDFFRAWVYGRDVPVIESRLAVQARARGFHAVLRLRQTQDGPPYPFASRVRFTGAGGQGEAEVTVRFTGREAQAYADLEFEPVAAELDPYREVPWKAARD